MHLYMVGAVRLELTTLWLKVRYSNQLSYAPLRLGPPSVLSLSICLLKNIFYIYFTFWSTITKITIVKNNTVKAPFWFPPKELFEWNTPCTCSVVFNLNSFYCLISSSNTRFVIWKFRLNTTATGWQTGRIAPQWNYQYPHTASSSYLVVGQGFEPCRSSPSGQSPRFISPRRIPMLPTISAHSGCPKDLLLIVTGQERYSSKVYDWAD